MVFVSLFTFLGWSPWGYNSQNRKESGRLDPWTCSPGHLKAALLKAEVVPVPADDAWKIPYLRRLLDERTTHFYNGDTKEEERVGTLINSLVVN